MTSYLDWQVGDRVVCVDADDAEELVEGREYTVIFIKVTDEVTYFKGRHQAPGRLHVGVEGAYGRMRRSGARHDNGFSACRFRKVITRKTDISIFTALLNTTKTVVDA